MLPVTHLIVTTEVREKSWFEFGKEISFITEVCRALHYVYPASSIYCTIFLTKFEELLSYPSADYSTQLNMADRPSRDWKAVT